MTLCWRVKCRNVHGPLKHKFLRSHRKPASLFLAPGAFLTDSSRWKIKETDVWILNIFLSLKILAFLVLLEWKVTLESFY